MVLLAGVRRSHNLDGAGSTGQRPSRRLSWPEGKVVPRHQPGTAGEVAKLPSGRWLTVRFFHGVRCGKGLLCSA
jgi:hypothetical protein